MALPTAKQIQLRKVSSSPTQKRREEVSRLGKTKTQLSQSSLNQTRDYINSLSGSKRQNVVDAIGQGKTEMFNPRTGQNEVIDPTAKIGQGVNSAKRDLYQNARQGASTGIFTGNAPKAPNSALPQASQDKINTINADAQGLQARRTAQAVANTPGAGQTSKTAQLRAQIEQIKKNAKYSSSGVMDKFSNIAIARAEDNLTREQQSQDQQEQAKRDQLLKDEAASMGTPQDLFATRDNAAIERGRVEPPKAPKQAAVDTTAPDAMQLLLGIRQGDIDPMSLTQDQLNTIYGAGQEGASAAENIIKMQQDRLTAERDLAGLEATQEGAEAINKYDERKDAQEQYETGQLRLQAYRQQKAIEEAGAMSGQTGASSFITREQAIVQNNLLSTLERREELNKFAKQDLDESILKSIDNARANYDAKISDYGFKLAELKAKENMGKNVSPIQAMKDLMSIMPKQSKEAIDWTGSEKVGHLTDKYGDPILDKNGNKRPIGVTPDKVKYQQVEIDGKKYAWNPENPSDIQLLGGDKGSQFFEGEDGFIASAPSSNIKNARIIGQDKRPDLYEKNIPDPFNGGMQSLAENCVLFAREVGNGVIDTTTGLVSVQDKQNAINERGVSDPKQFQAGDVLLTAEGTYGHAAVISSINPDGTMTLLEANRDPGRVTQGRTLRLDDTKVMGVLKGNESQEYKQYGDPDAEGSQEALDRQMQKKALTHAIKGLSLEVGSVTLGEKFEDDMMELIEDGDYGRVRDSIESRVLSGLTGKMKDDMYGSSKTLAMVDMIEKDLAEFESMGGDTGIFKGNERKVLSAIGRIDKDNPKLAEVANKIQMVVQRYRSEISGAAFSVQEAREYAGIFPSDTDTGELNAVKIKALRDVLSIQKEMVLRATIGDTNYGDIYGFYADKEYEGEDLGNLRGQNEPQQNTSSAELEMMVPVLQEDGSTKMENRMVPRESYDEAIQLGAKQI